MANKLDKLVVELSADTATLKRDLAGVNQQLDGFGKRANKTLSGFESAAKKAFGVFSIGIASRAIKGALDYADSIDKASKAAGVGAEFLQEFRFAADQNGVSLQGTDDVLRRFNRRLGEFATSGGGPAAKAFKDLDISIRDIGGNVRSTEDVLKDVIVEMGKVGTTAQKSAMAAQLFGDDFGPKLVTLLDQGIDGIDALRQSARDAGIVMEDDLIANTVKAKDEMEKFGTILTVTKNKLILDYVPALAEVAKAMNEAAQETGMLAAAWELLKGTSLAGPLGIIRVTEVDELQRLNEEIENTESVLLRLSRFSRPGNSEIQRLTAELQELKVARDSLLLRRGTIIRDRADTPDSAPAPFASKDDKAAEKAAKEAERAQKEYEKSLQSLLDKLDPVAAKTRDYMESVKLLDRALADGDLSGQQYDRMLVQLGTDTEALKKEQEEYEKSLTSLIDTLDPAGAKTREYMESVELLNRAFAEGMDPARYEELFDKLAVDPDQQKAMEDLLQATLDAVDPAAALKRELAELDALLKSDAGAEYGDEIRQRMEDLRDEIKYSGNEMSVFGEQAARNMQNHLADFLFDPFDEGLDGMVKGFAQAMQRMLAEAAAAQLFDSLGFGKGGGVGSSGFGGAFWDFIGSFATGTNYAPGGLALVGERGPELVHLPRGSQVTPNNRMGGDNISISVTVPPGSPAETRRAAAQGAREGVESMRRAQRYS